MKRSPPGIHHARRRNAPPLHHAQCPPHNLFTPTRDRLSTTEWRTYANPPTPPLKPRSETFAEDPVAQPAFTGAARITRWELFGHHGVVPPLIPFVIKIIKLVQAWVEIHRDELMADWELAVDGQDIFKIEPLK